MLCSTLAPPELSNTCRLSRRCWGTGAAIRNSSATTGDDNTKVVLDIPGSLAERADIIESARDVWREHYGASRTAKPAGDKLDKGIRKKKEAEFTPR